ncbi:hypothetical protein C8R47DRAFT_967791 [Mycena vitilis]|nr:hypothetical protein C8R47DRAFT_967791 [Mycena vitilis]
MGNRSISRDVKIAALNLFEHGRLSLKEILKCVGFSRRTFFRILKLWRTTGDVVRSRRRTGRNRLLHFDDVDYLVRLVQHQPDYFLDELQNLLVHNRFISVHYTTIHRTLERAGLSYKLLKDIAAERSEPSRLDYIREASQYPADYLGFLDETSKNDRTISRRRGRSKKGQRAIKRHKLVVEGSMHRDEYLAFLEHQVVSNLPPLLLNIPRLLSQLPLCSPFPGPLSVLVMDNARIHHGAEILELCDRFGIVFAVAKFMNKLIPSRCTAPVSSPVLPGLESNRGGLLQNQGLDSPEQ